jgi:hypothetical protein
MKPTIVGPLSELSTSIRVQGQLPGATVTVVSTRPGFRVVAKGVATSSDERFPLGAGAVLSQADLLFAIQDLGGDKSPEPSGDLGMTVQRKPQSIADLGHVGFVTHLFECGQFVWMGGAIPGAKVELVAQALPLGSGTAEEDRARFALSRAVPGQSVVTAHQIAPGLPNGLDTARAPDPLPLRKGQPLPAPSIQLPIRGCDASVLISNVFDGATVTLRRGSGATEVAGFDRDSLWFILQKEFEEGEDLEVRQDVARACERQGTLSPAQRVGPAKPVDPPKVEGPLCAGATMVRVSGLRRGAFVHLSANGRVYEGRAPPDQSWLDCGVDPLTTDPVSATQEVCHVVSTASAAVTVDPHPSSVPPTSIVGPLFACARSVSVRNVHKGATVQVFAKGALGEAAISAQVMVFGPNATIPVAPFLREGDEVFARQWACSDTSVTSAPEPVEAEPKLTPIDVLAQLFGGGDMVNVRGAVPGALVDVYVMHPGGELDFAGGAVADALRNVTSVHVNFLLKPGDIVFAKQSMCADMSEPGGRQVVREAPSFGPRPFYVFGHNPNSISDVKSALTAGANAIEPDLNVFEANQNEISVSHSEGDTGDPPLLKYLQDLHQVAHDNPQLAMVVFDCKPKVATAAHGIELLRAVREHLTFDNDLNIVISVAKIGEGDIFQGIADILGPREGLMIDAEDDPAAVAAFFSGLGVHHQCYGNGISVANSIIGPYYRYTQEHACERKAGTNQPNFVYVWTVNDDDEIREYIRIGVDGIISDDDGKLKGITQEPEFAPLIRLATRLDNPMSPENFNYGLIVHTGDVLHAGTDANVTFTIQGTLGSAQKTVNTQLIRRMERNEWNYITVPSPDLGNLTAVSVQRDNQGNAPDWFLDRVLVRSFRYGAAKQAIFNRWIDTTAVFTEPLV